MVKVKELKEIDPSKVSKDIRVQRAILQIANKFEEAGSQTSITKQQLRELPEVTMDHRTLNNVLAYLEFDRYIIPGNPTVKRSLEYHYNEAMEEIEAPPNWKWGYEVLSKRCGLIVKELTKFDAFYKKYSNPSDLGSLRSEDIYAIEDLRKKRDNGKALTFHDILILNSRLPLHAIKELLDLLVIAKGKDVNKKYRKK